MKEIRTEDAVGQILCHDITQIINDEKKGGDIDLLVRGSSERKGVLARIRMLARLKYFLGDQKIDIIGDHEDSPVAREALMTGIRLV